MTTLVAAQYEDFCIIAADSQSTVAYRKMDSSPVGKIQQNGKYLIAASGSGRGANILSFDWNPPNPVGDLDTFITRTLIPSMRKKFIDSGHELRMDGSSSSFDNELLIAVKGQIYHIFEDYGWERCGTKLYGSGSGGEFALGAMAALDVEKQTEFGEASALIAEAVRIASTMDIFSGGLIQVACQFTNGKSIITTIDQAMLTSLD